MLAALLMAVIELTGVTGTKLSARAFFDVNNVTVGDPMTLTMDFIGEADFSSLHPPRLASALDPTVWKLDQASAKTDTIPTARRVTWRIRPLKAGVLRFPPIDFRCGDLVFRTNEIPVHARPGQAVDIALDEEGDAMPPIPIEDGPSGTPDDWFAIRRLLHSGQPAEALERLNSLAWRYGQDPVIESAMIAARARLLGNPYAELPAWRVVLRPLLKMPLVTQLQVVAGWLLAFVVVMLALGKTIKHFAAVALITVLLSKPEIKVGEEFDFLFALETQASGTVLISSVEPDNAFALSLGDLQPAGKNRYRLPARYLAPVDNPALAFDVTVRVETSQETRRGGFYSSFTSIQAFPVRTAPIAVKASPLDPDSQPADFSGILGQDLTLKTFPDSLDVGTNDVITVTCRLFSPPAQTVYVPDSYLPPGAAFAWQPGEWKGYFVADGAPVLPEVECCYYDVKTQTYRRIRAGKEPIRYHE